MCVFMCEKGFIYGKAFQFEIFLINLKTQTTLEFTGTLAVVGRRVLQQLLLSELLGNQHEFPHPLSPASG